MLFNWCILDESMMAATVSANTCTSNPVHYRTDLSSDSSAIEITKRLAQLQLKTATIPKRQPTIVCEDIADDEPDFLDDDDEHLSESGETTSNDCGLLRSASNVSLTVPAVLVCEDQITEKRRPPLPGQSQ